MTSTITISNKKTIFEKLYNKKQNKKRTSDDVKPGNGVQSDVFFWRGTAAADGGCDFLHSKKMSGNLSDFLRYFSLQKRWL
jgi:hypothetical protein